jgi:hypothetical protein
VKSISIIVSNGNGPKLDMIMSEYNEKITPMVNTSDDVIDIDIDRSEFTEENAT